MGCRHSPEPGLEALVPAIMDRSRVAEAHQGRPDGVLSPEGWGAPAARQRTPREGARQAYGKRERTVAGVGIVVRSPIANCAGALPASLGAPW
jgi:hypothetical protein